MKWTSKLHNHYIAYSSPSCSPLIPPLYFVRGHSYTMCLEFPAVTLWRIFHFPFIKKVITFTMLRIHVRILPKEVHMSVGQSKPGTL